MAGRKKGNLTKDEKRFIQENRTSKTIPEIADAINRLPETVERFIKTNQYKMRNSEDVQVKETVERLQLSASWKMLIQQLDKDELLFATQRFNDLVKQFKEDVFATEEQQILKAVKYEIFMDRNSISQQEQIQELAALQKEKLETVKQLGAKKSDVLQNKLNEIGAMMEAVQASKQSLMEEYLKIEGQHQKLMGALKATREQRITKVEGKNKNFLDVLKQLQEDDNREREGKQQELMKLATQKEFERLAKPHKFGNNEFDLPLLSIDSLRFIDEKEAEESK